MTLNTQQFKCYALPITVLRLVVQL